MFISSKELRSLKDQINENKYEVKKLMIEAETNLTRLSNHLQQISAIKGYLKVISVDEVRMVKLKKGKR